MGSRTSYQKWTICIKHLALSPLVKRLVVFIYPIGVPIITQISCNTCTKLNYTNNDILKHLHCQQKYTTTICTKLTLSLLAIINSVR